MSKIDQYSSNQVMRIGSVIGSVSGLRKSANWEDYVLLSFDPRLIDTSHKDYLGATGSFLTQLIDGGVASNYWRRRHYI